MFVTYRMVILTAVNPCDSFCFYYYHFPSVNCCSVSLFHSSLILYRILFVIVYNEMNIKVSHLILDAIFMLPNICCKIDFPCYFKLIMMHINT